MIFRQDRLLQGGRAPGAFDNSVVLTKQIESSTGGVQSWRCCRYINLLTRPIVDDNFGIAGPALQLVSYLPSAVPVPWQVPSTLKGHAQPAYAADMTTSVSHLRVCAPQNAPPATSAAAAAASAPSLEAVQFTYQPRDGVRICVASSAPVCVRVHASTAACQLSSKPLGSSSRNTSRSSSGSCT